MLERIRTGLSFANVAAALALFIAIGGGTAFALESANIDDNAVTGDKAREQSVDSKVAVDVVADQTCNPDSTAFVDCATLFITLPRPLKVALNGAAGQVSLGTTGGSGGGGSCRFKVQGSALAGEVHPGEIIDETSTSLSNGFSLTAVTPRLSDGGSNAIHLECNETSGNVAFVDAQISAVSVG